MPSDEQAKWRRIFESLRRDLREGRYPQGVPLPSEESVVRRFGVSRITAVRAMDELVKHGLVYRKRGAGTFATKAARLETGLLGLIMPSLSFGEIFPAICQALARRAQQDGRTFLLGDISAPTPEGRAREACAVARAFVEKRVAGVVLQPLAFLKTPERVTREIISLFNRADIPVVLIDRDIGAAADARYDFVGIDNLSAGRALGAHLLAQGAARVHFLMRPKCASVIRDRLDGVQSALGDRRPKDNVIIAEPDDVKTLARLFRPRRTRPDAVVCESDYVAVRLGNTLARLGLSVPGDVMLAGFDDVKYAEIASPPLTTVRQPCEAIAEIAYRTMRERMQDADVPPRRILLPAPLVVRASTVKTPAPGARLLLK